MATAEKTQTPQQKLQEFLTGLPLPADKIHVYGRQIMITCRGRKTAERWYMLLGKAFTVRGIVETYDYNKKNTNTCINPSVHKVWRVAAVTARQAEEATA